MKFIRNFKSIHQRDQMVALSNSSLTGIAIFLFIYGFAILLLSIGFLSTFKGDIKLSYMCILAYALDLPFIIKNYDAHVIFNYLSDYGNVINGVSILGAGLAGYFGFTFAKTEYIGMMANIRQLTGANYYSDIPEATKEFAVVQKERIAQYLIDRKLDKKDIDLAVGFKVGGVPICRDYETKHFFISGGVGMGKTVAVWWMILDAIAKGHLVIIHCNKGDFTSKLIDMNGGEPIIIGACDARHSAHIWGLDYATEADMAELATKLIADSGNDPMWSEGTRMIVVGSMVYINKHFPKTYSAIELAWFLLKPLEEFSNTVLEYYPQASYVITLEEDENGNKKPGKTVQSFLITMIAQMGTVFRLARAYTRPETTFEYVCDFLDRKSVDGKGVPFLKGRDGKPLLKEDGSYDTDYMIKNRFSMRQYLARELKSNVLILKSDEKYRKLSESVNQSILTSLNNYINSPSYPEAAPHEPGVRLFLDEFPQMGKCDAIAPIMATGRSKNVGATLICQTGAQYNGIYGNDVAEEIMSLPGMFLYCNVDINAAQEASKAAGTREVERYSFTYGADGRRNDNWTRAIEPIAEPDAFFHDLGVKKGGINAVLRMRGGDVYKLFFPFATVKKVREGVIEANWVLPEFIKAERELMAKVDGDSYTSIIKRISVDVLKEDDAVNVDDLIKTAEEALKNSDVQPAKLDLSKAFDEKPFIPPNQALAFATIEPDDIMPPVDEINIEAELQPDDDKPDKDDFLPPI